MPKSLSFYLCKLCKRWAVITWIASDLIGDCLYLFFCFVGNIVVIKADITTIDGCCDSWESNRRSLLNNGEQNFTKSFDTSLSESWTSFSNALTNLFKSVTEPMPESLSFYSSSKLGKLCGCNPLITFEFVNKSLPCRLRNKIKCFIYVIWVCIHLVFNIMNDCATNCLPYLAYTLCHCLSWCFLINGGHFTNHVSNVFWILFSFSWILLKSHCIGSGCHAKSVSHVLEFHCGCCF